jgi:hypothetical protein
MDEPIFLRISPELRRSAYYVLAASVPLALACFWVSEFVGDETPVSRAVRSAFIFLLSMTMIVPLRWSLRIDDEGIARRLLFRWGDLWTWAEAPRTGDVFIVASFVLRNRSSAPQFARQAVR